MKRKSAVKARPQPAPRADDAEAGFRRRLAAHPGDVEALLKLGRLMTQTGRVPLGLDVIDRALALKPDFVEALVSRGAALNVLRRHEEAVGALDRAIALAPDAAEAHLHRGNALTALLRFEPALAAYDAALALRDDLAEAHGNRGVVLVQLSQFDEALAAYERAAAAHPRYFDPLFNRANLLRRLRRLDEALEAFERTLALRPDHPAALNGRGSILEALGREPEARVMFERALQIAPDFADPALNLGLIALSEGRWAQGLPAYELRWRHSTRLQRFVTLDLPVWRGEPVAGKRIVIYEEQGLGDVIQFARYAPLLEARGAEVTLLVAAKMATLMRSLPGRARVLSQLPAGETFDFQCPLMSLPLGFATEPASVPAQIPYLAADPQRAQIWAERLGSGGFKVGVAWGGSDLGRVLGKAVAPELFAQLARVPGVRLVSLQKDAEPPAGVETLGAAFDAGPDAFADTAAAMMSLDLIVTIDTSLAHLAGALARPVWVLLPNPPDWRWLRDGADTPWYPTMRLFRQRVRDDWASVFVEVEDRLRGLFSFGP